MGVVLVTGCRSGIGLATAVAFGRRGDRVFATMRDEADGGHLIELAGRERLPITVSSLDVTDLDAINAAVSEVVSSQGWADVLVNNAGVPGPLAAIEEVDEGLGRAAMEANFWGPFRLARAVLPHMRTRRSGVIINVSTFGVRLGGGARALFFYNVSKHALYQLSLSLRAELASTGVRVVDIEPGAFATGIYDDTKRPTIDESSPYAPMLREVDGRLANMVAAGASPDIVADAIVTAANDPASPHCVLVGHDAVAAVEAYQRARTQAWTAELGS